MNLDRAAALGIITLGVGVAWYVLQAVLAKNGGQAAVPLDDSYIHFQFARALARGAPLEYAVGVAPVAGSTSWLWPALLAPFVALGLSGSAVIRPAWGFGFLAHALLAWELFAVTKPLLSAPLRVLVAGLSLTFSAHLWFAASGMEVLPLAWLLVRTARRSAEWADLPGRAPPAADGRPATTSAKARATALPRAELVALAWLAPLMRPEGVLAALWVALTFVRFPKGTRRAPWALLATLGAFTPSLLNWLFSGDASTTTETVKWLPKSPYLGGAELVAAIFDNVWLLFGTLLNGEEWSAEFLPEWSAFALWPALPALVWLGWRKHQTFRALALAWVGMGLLIPTTYDTFLWNRLRYLWPFITPWFVGVAALLELSGQFLEKKSPKLRFLPWLVGVAGTASFIARSPRAVEDVAESARAISEQQVSLGLWAKTALPATALLGVSDTGAIAYFSERRTFDVVGLTTRGEAKYWSAGPGSRFEHYERLPRSALPTHFLLYPGWFALPPLLGEELSERTVPWATILGGTSMFAHVADYGVLGSAERPLEQGARQIIDQLDVADLESEALHGYELFEATQIENKIVEHEDGRHVDGGRSGRTRERFRLNLPPESLLVARLGAARPTHVRVRVDGAEVGTRSLEARNWVELGFALGGHARQSRPLGKSRDASPPSLVELDSEEPFTALYYFSIAPGEVRKPGTGTERASSPRE